MNPYLKIALSAVVATYIAPTIANKLARPEMNGADSLINIATEMGSTGLVAGGVYWALSQIAGGGKASPAGGGGAT